MHLPLEWVSRWVGVRDWFRILFSATFECVCLFIPFGRLLFLRPALLFLLFISFLCLLFVYMTADRDGLGSLLVTLGYFYVVFTLWRVWCIVDPRPPLCFYFSFWFSFLYLYTYTSDG